MTEIDVEMGRFVLVHAPCPIELYQDKPAFDAFVEQSFAVYAAEKAARSGRKVTREFARGIQFQRFDFTDEGPALIECEESDATQLYLAIFYDTVADVVKLGWRFDPESEPPRLPHHEEAKHEHNSFLCPAHVAGCSCINLKLTVCNPYHKPGFCPDQIDLMPGEEAP